MFWQFFAKRCGYHDQMWLRLRVQHLIAMIVPMVHYNYLQYKLPGLWYIVNYITSLILPRAIILIFDDTLIPASIKYFSRFLFFSGRGNWQSSVERLSPPSVGRGELKHQKPLSSSMRLTILVRLCLLLIFLGWLGIGKAWRAYTLLYSEQRKFWARGPQRGPLCGTNIAHLKNGLTKIEFYIINLLTWGSTLHKYTSKLQRNPSGRAVLSSTHCM